MSFVLFGIVELVIIVYVVVDVWRSSGATGAKILWSVFAVFCSIAALIIWLVVGRRAMYGETTA